MKNCVTGLCVGCLRNELSAACSLTKHWPADSIRHRKNHGDSESERIAVVQGKNSLVADPSSDTHRLKEEVRPKRRPKEAVMQLHVKSCASKCHFKTASAINAMAEGILLELAVANNLSCLCNQENRNKGTTRSVWTVTLQQIQI